MTEREPDAIGYMIKGGLVYFKLPCGCNEGVPQHLPRFECRCGKAYSKRVFGETAPSKED